MRRPAAEQVLDTYWRVDLRLTHSLGQGFWRRTLCCTACWTTTTQLPSSRPGVSGMPVSDFQPRFTLLSEGVIAGTEGAAHVAPRRLCLVPRHDARNTVYAGAVQPQCAPSSAPIQARMSEGGRGCFFPTAPVSPVRAPEHAPARQRAADGSTLTRRCRGRCRRCRSPRPCVRTRTMAMPSRAYAALAPRAVHQAPS